MKRNVYILLAVLVLAALSCTISPGTLFATPTPPPTYTPLPTYTPQPTFTPLPTFTPVPTNTATPVPQVPGVDIPLEFQTASFTVTKVTFATSWNYDGETRYPKNQGDTFLAVHFDVTGDLFSVTFPINTENSEITFHMRDNKGRVDQWNKFEPNDDGSKLIALFVVDGTAKDYIFTFPDGQEIDLAPFLK